MRVTALTRVTAPRVATVLTVVAAEPEDELPVPLSEIVVAARAPASVKSDCTVSAIVPFATVAVR